MIKDWDNLRYFITVAQSGTVSSAAQKLQVSHATVLRRIEKFEHDLNAKLFNKLQSGYELTPLGKTLLNNALDTELSIRSLEQKLHQQNLSQHKLRISQPGTQFLNLYNLYSEFSRLYPNIILEINSSTERLDLNRHETDVAIRITDSPQESLVGRQVGRIGYSAYATEAYLKNFSKPYNLNEFEWISLRTPAMPAKKDHLLKRLKKPKVVLYTNSFADVISAMKANMGVGQIPYNVAILNPDFKQIPNTEGVNNYPVWLLTHRELRNNKAVKTFMSFMANRLGQLLSPPL